MPLWDALVDFLTFKIDMSGLDLLGAEAPSLPPRPRSLKDWFGTLPVDLKDALFVGFAIDRVEKTEAAGLIMLETTIDEIRTVRKGMLARLRAHPDQNPDPKAGYIASDVVSAGNRMIERRKH